ncbi:sensor histidine kinase [Ruminococcus callidus]|uniref:sensor histidine kinase n=1 Tax=Ruminococcus callidus TaxID=40519 RepID=UPI002666BD9B|nr:GHKL domain-containing protein [uncultured Ruminococcus sp.]
MIWQCTEILAVIVECMIVTRMLIQYFKFRSEDYRILKWLLLFSLLFATDMAGTFGIANETFLISSCLLIEIAFSTIFLKGNIFEKILISVINYVLVYFINLPVMSAISAITGIPMLQLQMSQNVERVVCLFITKILYFAVTQFILSFRKKEEYHFSRNEWIMILSAFMITLLIGISMYMITVGGKTTEYIYVAVTLLISCLDAVIFIFLRKMNRTSQIEKERDIMEIQLQRQQDEMQHLQQQYEEISILRHDFRNGIDCLCGMIEQGDCSGALAYAKRFKERKVNTILSQVQCSSTMLNAVVNAKFNDAQSKGIDTSLRLVVQIPHDLEFDLSIMLSNLLDNAIEACEKNPSNAQILLTISEEAGYYRLVVRNTIAASVLKKNQELKTEKANKKLHGWGLRSVTDLVSKRNGLIDFYEKEGMFYVDILLPIEENLHLGD